MKEKHTKMEPKRTVYKETGDKKQNYRKTEHGKSEHKKQEYKKNTELAGRFKRNAEPAIIFLWITINSLRRNSRT